MLQSVALQWWHCTDTSPTSKNFKLLKLKSHNPSGSLWSSRSLHADAATFFLSRAALVTVRFTSLWAADFCTCSLAGIYAILSTMSSRFAICLRENGSLRSDATASVSPLENYLLLLSGHILYSPFLLLRYSLALYRASYASRSCRCTMCRKLCTSFLNLKCSMPWGGPP